jgi:hypothetical protein
MLDISQRISPRLTDWYLSGPGDAIAGQRTDTPDDGVDNLFTPSTGRGSTTGDFGARSKTTSVYTRKLAPHPIVGRVAVAAGLAAGALVLRRAGSRR